MTELVVKWETVLIDLIVLGLGGLILLIFVVAVTPTKRGFYCDDETIRYPFHSSTIPNWGLYIYGFSIPFVVIIATELLRRRRGDKGGRFLNRQMPSWFLHMYRNLVDFLFGCICSQLLTDIGKYSVGRLRPNFIDVCKPNVLKDDMNCSKWHHMYITDYKCTDSDDDAKDSRVSFPSGHSSFSAFTMLYIVIYIQVKWRVNSRSTWRLLKCALQLLLLLIAYFTALSRVMDNKHHWSDVTAGALVGAISASLTARYVSHFGRSENASYDMQIPQVNEGTLDIEANVTPVGNKYQIPNQPHQSHHQSLVVPQPISHAHPNYANHPSSQLPQLR